jgi:hypothetical protein
MLFPSSILVSAERRTFPWALLLAIVSLVSALLVALPLAAKGPAPDRTISLESLGFQTIAPRYLLSGGTMMTLDYVDDTHLLVTFGVPRLMRRLADCAPDDQDRVVDAVLLELPSGRELARTEWRFHDISQYLWPLGHGFFLLRERNTLTTFAPLAQLPSGDAFRLRPFLHFDKSITIDAIYVSADHDLLTIQTSKRLPKHEQQLASTPASVPPPATTALPTSLGPSQPNRSLTLLRRDPTQPAASSPDDPQNPIVPDNPIHNSFIRLLPPTEPNGSLIAQHAGFLDTRKRVVIPLTAEGFLRTRDSSSAGVTLDFATFTGKITDLGGFDTSCPPSPTFLTHSEFVAFGCRGSDDHLTLAGFNIRGDLLWQILFSDSQAYPSFVAANSAGRFAFSRTLTTGTLVDAQSPFPDELSSQEVRVLQTYNGRQLLRVATSPIQRSGQNYALSPNGLSLAVIHDPIDPRLKEVQHKPAIEIYKLPPLTDKEQHEVNAELALAPPPSGAPIAFSGAQVKDALAASQPGGLDAIEINPAAALLPDEAQLPQPAPTTPATSPADDSRPHFSYRSSDATIPPKPAAQPPAPRADRPPNQATGQPTDQATGGDDQADHPRKRPSLYDPDYDGSPEQFSPNAPSNKSPQQ